MMYNRTWLYYLLYMVHWRVCLLLFLIVYSMLYMQQVGVNTVLYNTLFTQICCTSFVMGTRVGAYELNTPC